MKQIPKSMKNSIKNFCKEETARAVDYLFVRTGYDERAYDPELCPRWAKAFAQEQKEFEGLYGDEKTSLELIPCKYGALFRVPSESDAWMLIKDLYTNCPYEDAYCAGISYPIATDYDPQHKLLMVQFDGESG